MRMKAFLVLAVAAWAATAFAEVPQVLTYRGVLQKTGGFGNGAALELTFRLYDSEAPGRALWARTMRVQVDGDGVFYAELADANGNDPDAIGYTLADAMGAIKGAPEIGLTPPDAPELKPRQRLSTGVRAARAARAKAADVVYAPTGASAGGGGAPARAKAADVVYAPTGAAAEGVDIDTAVVQSLTVGKGAPLAGFPPYCTLTQLGLGQTRELGGGSTQITVRGVRVPGQNWPSCFSQGSFTYATNSAPCDMILTYEGADGAFSVIVPAGGKIAGGGAQTMFGTAFGNR